MNPAARRRGMTELFGIPTGRLTLALLAISASGALVLAFLALRDRVAFKMAVRNAPRRPTQTALILLGLMLATLLFSAAFTTGDTLTNSLRTQALKNIGRVDVRHSDPAPEDRRPPRPARDTSTNHSSARSRTTSLGSRASREWRRSRKKPSPSPRRGRAFRSRRWTCSAWMPPR